MHQSRQDATWNRVDRYVISRIRRKRDVYGWARVHDMEPRRALLLVSNDADLSTFPSRISDIEIELKPVPAPDVQDD